MPIPLPLIFASFALGLGLGQEAPPAARPNVLVIVMDDVSERDIERIETPRFDALAAAGMRFRRAYSAPVCSPARRMLTFGNYWERDSGTPCTGQNYAAAQPSVEAISLPRLFRNAGYATALFGKWHLGSYPGVAEGQPWQLVAQQHGFQTWRAGLSANIRSSCLRLGNYERWQRIDDLEVSVSRQYNTHAVEEAATDWIEERAVEPLLPWFAMVCFQSAHGPFHVPPGMSEPGKSYSYRAQFELMVQDLDHSIGAILDAVDLERTLVLLVGDNGTPNAVPYSKAEAERGKTTTFEGGIQIPMLWSGPGVRAGSESEALVSLVDALPTLADLIEQRSPEIEALDGISIRDVLADPSLPAHEFVWAGCSGPNVAPGGDYAVVTRRWKLRLVGAQTSLYDLDADPFEQLDLALPANRERASDWDPKAEDQYTALIAQLTTLLNETRPQQESK